MVPEPTPLRVGDVERIQTGQGKMYLHPKTVFVAVNVSINC